MKDMLFYRSKLNELIEEAYKNNIHFEINKDPYMGLVIRIIDEVSKEKCIVKNSKIKVKDNTVMVLGNI